MMPAMQDTAVHLSDRHFRTIAELIEGQVGIKLPGGDAELGVYPVEGASLVARGLPNAISMIVAGEPGAFPSLPAVAYMEKVVVGSGARGALDLDDGVADNLRRIAFARFRLPRRRKPRRRPWYAPWAIPRS